ncbi:aldose 1-epimerase [Bifidobacterium reuteri DSM 23975]|nr:D-hexose-6-phosphate mutarotase [Bifidobacterium reuteri]KFI88274.1 aldose 1-epimerase [Bifidobacterium reuteri DSM 23975]
MTSFNVRTLDAASGRAIISDYAAHVLSWVPAGGQEVIWTPSTLRFEDGQHLGGGVPICFPWFGPGFAHGHQTAKTPLHGFARARNWRFDEQSFTGDHARFILDAAQLQPGDAPWLDDEPASDFRAVYDVTLGGGSAVAEAQTVASGVHVPSESANGSPVTVSVPSRSLPSQLLPSQSLTMALTVTNTGDKPMTFEAALHSYLHVGDVAGARLSGLEGATYLDATESGFPPKTQDTSEVAFGDFEVNRVYYSDASLELHDDVLGRTIHIAKSGSPQTVVWNPGKAGGETMSDTRPDAAEWRGFAAVEAAVCRDRAVTLAPGASHTLSQTLTVA